jgi:periplasmic protein CpxP/Spy
MINKVNKDMKHRIIPMAALTLGCWMLLVPATRSQAQSPAQKLQQLSQVLGLSPVQKEQLLPLLEVEGPKIEAIKTNPSLTNGQKLLQMRAIHQQTDPQVKAILSPQQYQTWQSIREQEIQQKVGQMN